MIPGYSATLARCMYKTLVPTEHLPKCALAQGHMVAHLLWRWMPARSLRIACTSPNLSDENRWHHHHWRGRLAWNYRIDVGFSRICSCLWQNCRRCQFSGIQFCNRAIRRSIVLAPAVATSQSVVPSPAARQSPLPAVHWAPRLRFECAKCRWVHSCLTDWPHIIENGNWSLALAMLFWPSSYRRAAFSDCCGRAKRLATLWTAVCNCWLAAWSDGHDSMMALACPVTTTALRCDFPIRWHANLSGNWVALEPANTQRNGRVRTHWMPSTCIHRDRLMSFGWLSIRTWRPCSWQNFSFDIEYHR